MEMVDSPQALPSSLSPSRMLDNRYELAEPLGKGGMATVYRALDTRLGRQVALKMLKDSQAASRERFTSEVRTLARLEHPNLVRLLDAGLDDNDAWLVMELVDGPSLAQLSSHGPLEPAIASAIAVEVASGLDYVHHQGIVHRDVKPANILIGSDGRARLADFGIARLVDTAGLTATGITVGTPAYLAPEQVAGGAVGPKADVYALGLVLIEALSGTRSFVGSPAELAAIRLASDPKIPPNVPLGWRRLLSSMTERDPAKRPTAAQVREAVTSMPLPGRDMSPSPCETAGVIPEEETLSLEGPTAAIPTAAIPGSADPTAAIPAAEMGIVNRTKTARFATLQALAQNKARRVTAGDPTATSPLIDSLPSGRSSSLSRRKAYGIAALATAVGLVAGLLLAGLAGTPASTASRHKASAQHSSSKAGGVPTTSPTTTTTTTSPPSPATAEGQFITALETGVEDRTVTASAAQALLSQLQPLLSQATQENEHQLAQQVGSLASTLDRHIASGGIVGSTTVDSLQTALSNLATALGVSPVQQYVTGGAGPSGAGPAPPNGNPGKGNKH